MEQDPTNAHTDAQTDQDMDSKNRPVADLQEKLRPWETTLRELSETGYRSIIIDAQQNLNEEEMLRRMDYVMMIVSLWSHACMVDGELAQAEEISVGQLTNYFFGEDDAIFPIDKVDIDVVFNDITETFLKPLPISEIIEFGSSNPHLAGVFYEQTCCIVASDGKLHQHERSFLDQLASGLQLEEQARQDIEQRYIRELA